MRKLSRIDASSSTTRTTPFPSSRRAMVADATAPKKKGRSRTTGLVIGRSRLAPRPWVEGRGIAAPFGSRYPHDGEEAVHHLRVARVEAPQVEAQESARLHFADRLLEVGDTLDRLTVHLGDHVTRS